MGPPIRKQLSQDPSQVVGRVTVYCVAASIDLKGLRAHVFRRGFGAQNQRQYEAVNNIMNNLNSSETENSQISSDLSNLLLSRGISSDTSVNDEVLHVSNSPMFLNLNTIEPVVNKVGSPSSWMRRQQLDDINVETEIVNEENDEDDKESERRRVLLFMATQDIFYFDYGCVVFWGLTPQEEQAALTELKPFMVDEVNAVELSDSYDTLEYSYDRKANPQRPIRFDRMKLRTLNVEEKLALSYGMAQSSKLFVLESRVLQSVEMTRYLPRELSTKGKISSKKQDLNRLIGKLFVEQTEVNLFSSILDQPDFLWDDDEHLPTYEYIRSYLEVDDRVSLLNSRLGVIRELLDVLNAQVASNNSERLEWIVIWLISVEIILGIVSNPIFAGKRILASLLVPTAVLLFKRLNWSGWS
eukprot:gene17727-23319_t